MHLTLIAGSHRKNSQSVKVARFLGNAWSGLAPDRVAQVIDLPESSLPLWDGQHDVTTHSGKAWAAIAPSLSAADALVIISPEWNGMATAAIKNFFLFADANLVGHKPAMLVSVSAGISGAYPISDLRASSYKNCRICYIPEHLIVRNVNAVMNEGPAATKDDELIRARGHFALSLLAEYARALSAVRASGLTNHPDFPNGM
jgi:NAD(P)H-dependent FMN reductase